MRIRLPKTRTPGASGGHYGSLDRATRHWKPERRKRTGPPPLPRRVRRFKIRRRRRPRYEGTPPSVLLMLLIIAVTFGYWALRALAS